MSVWTVGWLLWILWFLIEETWAIKKGGWQATLSGHVWHWFAIKDAGGDLRDRTPGWRLRRVALITLMGWLCFHFFSGGKF